MKTFNILTLTIGIVIGIILTVIIFPSNPTVGLTDWDKEGNHDSQ